MHPSKKSIYLFFIVFLFFSLLLASCATVPITGRKQLNLVSDDSMLSMSFQQYNAFIQSSKLSRNTEQTRRVKNVGSRLQKAVEQYMTEHGMGQELKNYQWEFNLIESDEKNAWAMPGGKVVIYSGILPVTQTETGLAVVMGHEIAHAVAKHGNERMSHELVTQMGGIALSTALSNSPQQTQSLWMQVFGIGSQMGFLLPYSRLQENEADHLGLIFMAMAGYNPEEAISFWQRMMAEKKGQAPPEFLSTHPSDPTRINHIRSLIPEVLPYYYRTKPF